MHGFAFGGARFVDDALEQTADRSVRQRSGVRTLGIFQDFALTVGLIERKIFRLLGLADFQRPARALIEKLYEFAVDFIDAAPPITERHVATSRRESPRRGGGLPVGPPARPRGGGPA